MSDPARPGLSLERVLPIFLIVFVDVLGLTIILPLLHLYGATYGASAFEIGLVAATFPLAQLIGVPLMGALSDRYGRKPLLLISQATTFAGFVILALSNSLWMIIFSRALDGLFGANLATAQAALSDVTDEKSRAQGLGLTGAAFGLGFLVGPVIALLSLEFSDSLATPAVIAAAYSLCSIVLTIFVFKETLPPERRGAAGSRRGPVFNPLVIARMIGRPGLGVLLLLMFAQQVIFFGFEALLGLFTLSRLGLLGQGNAIIFLVVGFVLVYVQVSRIGPWSRKYGEHRLVQAALSLLALGLLLFAFTPEQPQPFYVRQMVINQLRSQAPTSTEAIIGDIAVQLPEEGNNGIGGMLWVMIAIVPVAVGAGLIRPSLNSLMTRQVSASEYGGVLGVSTAFVSAANAVAPLLGGLLFQAYGPSMPFLVGGVMMAGLALLSLRAVRPVAQPAPA